MSMERAGKEVTARRPALPLPPHFDSARAASVWPVGYQDLAGEAAEWRDRWRIPAAARDEFRVLLLVVDMQNTFCLPDFELFVGGRSGQGAVEDVRRASEFIYRNGPHITEIRVTLDTHQAMQIFHPIFWIDRSGAHPPPYTPISKDDVDKGLWQVNPEVAPWVAGGDMEWLSRYAVHYVDALNRSGRYDLTIWPYHAVLGSSGHSLASLIEEAVFFHGQLRGSPVGFELKGANPLTENYSVLSPEVREGPPSAERARKIIAERNERLIREMLEFDAVIIGGEAKSHCVSWTVDDLLSEIRLRDPSMADRIYLLEDCTTPVVVPGVVDYTERADEAFREFAQAGMHVVRSTDPVSSWPGQIGSKFNLRG